MILKNSFIIGIFTLLSVFLGIVRDRLLADHVGVGANLDVYNAAFRIPDLSLGILFAFVSSATVIPFISKAVKENNKKEIEERISSLTFFFGIIMLGFAFIIFILAPYLKNILVPGFTEIQKSQFVIYTRILMIQPFLLGLSTLLSTLAQAKNRFYIYGSAPILYTLSIIFSILFYEKYGLNSIIFGVVFGACLHFSLQLYFVLKDGIKISIKSFKKNLIKEQLKISIPRSGSVIVTNLRFIFFTSFATTLGVGILSAFTFALRVMEAGLLLLPQTLSIASIPTLSEKSQTDEKNYNKIIYSYSVKVFIIAAAGALLMALFSEIAIFVLYGDTGSNDIIKSILLVLMVAFPFASFNTYISNALSAGKDTKTQFFANIASTPIAIAVSLYMKYLGYGFMSLVVGFASASILLSIFIVVLLFIKKNIYEY